MKGKLHIIGVGPGDPDLLTVKAVRVLGNVSHVFVPVSAAQKPSLAYDIARQHIQKEAVITELIFPMLKDRDKVEMHALESYEKIQHIVAQGTDAAFITLGDPCTYSTAWALIKLFMAHDRDIEIDIVPGITSYAAAAARTLTPLAEGNEFLSIVSSNDSLDQIEKIIDASETVIFLKTYRYRSRLFQLLEKKGLINQCIYIQRCGMDGEIIISDLNNLPADPDYFSMIIMKKQAVA